jgi:hypothetical protein
MVNYVCEKCDKIFIKKYNYVYHINRKFPCTKTNNKIYSCSYCDLSYTRKCNLNKHLIYHSEAIEKQATLEYILEEMRQMREENKEIKEENKDLKMSVSQLSLGTHTNNINTINTTNINNNIININNVNVQLVPFGKEDFTSIPETHTKHILSRGFEAIPTLIKYIHFNKKKPQYHNCYISNNRDKYSITFDGTKWNLVETIDVVNTLRDNSQCYLEDKFEFYYDSLEEPTIIKFKNFLAHKDTDELAKRYKETIKLLLYNNRDMVIALRDLQEKQLITNIAPKIGII